VSTDLELGKVPRGVFMSRALDVPERSLIGGNIAMDIEGYLNFASQSTPRLSRLGGDIRTLQELVSLVPIHVRLKVDVRSRVRPQGR